MNLIAPPPVTAPDAPVPGGPVYSISAALWSWMTGKGPAPWAKPAPPLVTPQPAHPDSVALVEAVNRQRAARGLVGLAYDAAVSGVAQYWSQSQANRNTMGHGPGSSFATRVWSVRPGTRVGECVGAGYPDVPSVVAGWLGSPPHRAIVLGDFAGAGAGVAEGRDGNLYWTLDVIK